MIPGTHKKKKETWVRLQELQILVILGLGRERDPRGFLMITDLPG